MNLNNHIALFRKGVDSFNNQKFYDSHEYFEEIWMNRNIEDRLLIQGLLQLAVAFFHISNLNRRGAIGLFNKSIKKLILYKDKAIVISNINEVIDKSTLCLKVIAEIEEIKNFDWSLVPRFNLKKN